MKKNYNRSDEALAKKIFRMFLETKQVPGEPKGVIDFYYSEFMEASEGKAPHGTYVSILLNSLINSGRIDLIHRATSARPGRYNVLRFLEEEGTIPEVEVVVTKDQTPQALPAPAASVSKEIQKSTESLKENEVTIADVHDTIKQMITFLHQNANEMTAHLTKMMDKAAFGDLQVIKDLQENLTKVTGERDQLVQQVAQLQEQLSKRPETRFNKHVLIRLKNSVLDDMERFILAPSFEKNHRVQGFRNDVKATLDKIMKEVGANE